MKNNYSYFQSILVFNVLILLFLSCTTKTEMADQEEEKHSELIELTQEQFDRAGIIIGRVDKRDIGTELQVNGLIDVPPHGKVSIHLPYGGFLKATDMLEGTKVKKGQLLAVIENPDFISFQQDYLKNLAEQEFLKAEFERQEALFLEEVISKKEFQQSKSAFDINQVLVKTMGDRLRLIGFDLAKIANGNTSPSVKILSPISGSVREIYANVGKYIEAKTAIMDLTDNTDLHVELSVYENDIPLIEIGQKIRFSVASSTKVREAEIFLIGSGVRTDRSVTVHGHLNEVEDDLLPGMYVSANIIISSNEAWAVPEEAIVRFQGKHFVYLLDGKKQEDGQSVYHFEMREVIAGTTEDGYVEINYTKNENDISSDDVVLKGAFTILSKEKNSDGGGHRH